MTNHGVAQIMGFLRPMYLWLGIDMFRDADRMAWQIRVSFDNREDRTVRAWVSEELLDGYQHPEGAIAEVVGQLVDELGPVVEADPINRGAWRPIAGNEVDLDPDGLLQVVEDINQERQQRMAQAMAQQIDAELMDRWLGVVAKAKLDLERNEVGDVTKDGWQLAPGWRAV